MIKDHQDLLERYVKAELTAIGECSGSIRADVRRLKESVEDYSARHSLTVDVEWFDPYLFDV